MAEPKRPKGDDASVLGSLPATRPTRLSRRARAEGEGETGGVTAAKAAPKKPAAKKKPAAAKPARAKPKPKPKAAAAEPAGAPVAEAPKPPRPRAVRPATPALSEPVAKAGEKRADADTGPAQSGRDLATTVVQAAGELAQIGLTVGGQIIKRAVDRLPRK